MAKKYLLFVVLLTWCYSLYGKVLRIEIESRDTLLNGQSWGEAGAYELITGKVFFGTDPMLPQNQKISDINYAPFNEDGLVLSSADLIILKPIDPAKSITALVEVSNRGGKFTPTYFLGASGSLLDPANPLMFGDGLVLKKGITIIWVGWQFDLPESDNLLNFNCPVAKFPEGTPITGLVRSDWTLDEATNNLGLGHRDQLGYPVYDPQSDLHILTKRSGRNAERITVDRNKWGFGKLENGVVKKDDRSIYSELGFEPGMIYELVYYAADPPIVGLGLAALRDIISYAKYDPSCLFPVKFGIAAGVSQTGRFLRQFNYQGFNEDEQSRRAYDGHLIITAGAGRGSFNHRFAQPSRDAHRYSAFFYPTDVFPFAFSNQLDLVTNEQDGLLNHLSKQSWPKIVSVNTGYEYWGRSASLIHTDPQGKTDLALLENERIYHIASGQHYVNSLPPAREGQNLFIGNPLEFRPNYRALLINLIDWVEEDLDPPPSRFPRIQEATLVKPASVDYPKIPFFQAAKFPQEPYRVDYGADWKKGVITLQPPRFGEPFEVLVPQVDAFGNEISGIRNTEVAVPLATYLPYSLRRDMAGGNGEIADFVGTFIPLATQNQASPDDSRPTIRSLYKNKLDYLQKVQDHLSSLEQNRYILKEDRHRILLRSSLYWNWITRESSSQNDQLKIMSFNIRYDNPGDGASRWDNRKAMVVEVIESAAPDFLGLQEALNNQCLDIAKMTKNYKWIGVAREDGEKRGEYAPIFYQRKKWKMISWGTFWLSETPDKPSKGWDAAHERIVTYAKFKQKNSEKTVHVFNTHFDHRGIEARIQSAKLIRAKIGELTDGEPFIICGDFNINPQTEAYRTIIAPGVQNPIMDTKLLSLTEPVGPNGTFSGFQVKPFLPEDQIDYIFCSQSFDVEKFEVITKSENGLYASDHFAILAELRF